jgi:hypothetical protein
MGAPVIVVQLLRTHCYKREEHEFTEQKRAEAGAGAE